MERLRRASDVATIAACIAIVLFLGNREYQRWMGRENAKQPDLAGKMIPLQVGAGHERATAIVVLSGKCGYCRKGGKFYRQLQSVASGSAGVFRLVAMMPDGPEEKAFIREFQLEGVPQAGPPPRDLRINMVPTLILLDGNKRVRHWWTGLLTPEQQREVLEKLNRLVRG